MFLFLLFFSFLKHPPLSLLAIITMAFTSSKMAKLLPRNRMEVTSHHFDLHTSLSSLPVEARESAAQDGVRLLQQLKPALRRVPDAIDPSTWVAQIDKAITQFQGQRSLVGIVGGTGAGKTSFINALLDEETLLPTNCMRACTATITEIAYNTGPSKYRAVIEFLSRDDWEDELIKGFQVLFDANGKLVKDSTNEDSEAGVFYSKIRAIYTELTRDALERSSINGLLNHLGVSVLGRTEDFSSDDAPQFAHRLQTIVDSKDKHAKGPRKEVAYWPIIKRVRLYVRAKALSTGVTLVDLPGIQDSTPARAKIAETYMKTCSGLIVTAPIHRAADDRVAKNLLGPKFRRQVILDGGYSTMTFACTKIDEINIREMSNVAELRPELKRMNAYIDEKRQEQASTEQQLAQKQPELAQAEKRLVETSAKYDIYEDITREGRGLLSNSSLTNSPHPGQKRRLPDGGPAPDGKRQAMDSGGEIVGGDQDDRQAQPDVHTNDSTDYAVTQEAQDEYQKLDQQFAEIQNLREQAKQEKDELAADVVQLRARLDEIQYAISRLEDQKRANCIRHRNRYVIQAIKSDFIAGVRESDEERSGLDDNWDPATETRDYDKLANELPVLTVSARAYQKKMGRANDEQEPAGFTTLEDTGIPAALRHCEQLTLAGRRKNADYFLASMSKLLNTLNLWLANQVDSCKVSDMQREQARLLLQDKLSELKNVRRRHSLNVAAADRSQQTFNKLIRSTVEDIGQHLRKAIYKHLGTSPPSTPPFFLN